MANRQSSSFLDPLWRRVLLITACAIWTLVELYYGNMLWVAMVGFVTVYGAWNYLYAYEPSDTPPDGA